MSEAVESSGATQVERISLIVDAPEVAMPGLDTSIGKLRSIDGLLKSVNEQWAALGALGKTPINLGMRTPPAPRSSSRSGFSSRNVTPIMGPEQPPAPAPTSGYNLMAQAQRTAGYAAAASVVYGGLSIAKNGVESIIEAQYAEKRLSNVYRGQSSDVRKLTDDVMRLAAANGQSTHS